MEESGHDGEGAVHATYGVADGEARPERVQTLVAIDGHLAGKSLDDLVVCGLVRIGACGAKPGDGAEDDLRIDLGDHFVADAQAIHDARPEVLDDDIRVLRQSLEDLLALGALGVEAHGLLVAVLGEETRAHQLLVVVGDDAEFAGQVPVLGILDLDDLGAQERQVQ